LNNSLSTINFHKHDVSFILKEKLLLKTFLTSILSQEKVLFKSISYIFCNDEFLLKLNQQYLNHDTLTDILTFTLSNSTVPLVSEIYISIERVEENAANLIARKRGRFASRTKIAAVCCVKKMRIRLANVDKFGLYGTKINQFELIWKEIQIQGHHCPGFFILLKIGLITWKQ